MIEQANTGGRVVHLFIPFKFGADTITKIEMRAFEWGDAQDWEEGKIKSAVTLLARLVGKPEAFIRKIKYPDAQRVMDEFLRHLPYPIDQAVREGTVPLPRNEVDTPTHERGLSPDDPPIPMPADFPGDPNQEAMEAAMAAREEGFEGLDPNG